MQKPIAALFVNPNAYEHMARILEDENLHDISNTLTTYAEVLKAAKSLAAKGAKAIIARGGSAELLRRSLSVPVVNLDYTFGDFYRVVSQAAEHAPPRECLFVGLDYVLEKFETFKAETGCAIATMRGLESANVYGKNEVADLEARLAARRDEGIKVIIGGNPTVSIAEKVGLKGIYVAISLHETMAAIKEARYHLAIDQEYVKSIQSLNHLFNIIREGLIATDARGRITQINKEAQAMLKTGTRKIEGSSLDSLLPVSWREIQSGASLSGDIMLVAGQYMAVSVDRLHNPYEHLHYVVTLQKVDQIQKIDRKFRMLALAKGRVAKYTFDDIIGESGAIRRCIDSARAFASSDHTVLLQGETGTGKELFAQSIHSASERSKYPFVALNCSAVAENLLESELFGYVKGAFTGARAEGKAGIFELADRGTIFLDEISEIPLHTQTRLLRVLQEREVVRLGDDRVIPLDIRVIAATNKNLVQEVDKGRFRKDLYYRLGVLPLRLPPLRDREDDVILLLLHFLGKIGKYTVSAKARAALRAMPWNGNIRELENMAMRLSLLSENRNISARDVANAMLDVSDEELSGSISRIEQERILQVLDKTGGNKRTAAKLLGISTATLWRRLKKYNADI